MIEKNKQAYDPILYRVCKHIVMDVERYKGTPIYEKVLKMGDGPIGLTEEERANVQVYAITLHNQIKTIFEVLRGRDDVLDDANLPMGYNVKPLMDVTSLSVESIIEAINILCVADFSKRPNYRKSDEKQRIQIKRHLYKIDVERSDEILNNVIENMYRHSKNMPTISLDSQELARLGNNIECAYEKCRRFLIRVGTQNELYEKMILDEIEKECPQFHYLKKYYHTWLFVDLRCYDIMQYLNRALVNELIDFSRFFKCFEETVNELIEKQELENKIMEKDVCQMDAYEYLFRLFSFYKFRDRLLGNIKAIKNIKELCNKRTNPAPQYSLLEPADDAKKITQKEIQELFTEGENVNKNTFGTQYEKIKKSIPLYNAVSGRSIAYSSITAKAIYREIYLDDVLYKGEKCKNIFNRFLESGKLGKDEYYFINEKINLGIWREYGYIEEYFKKNEFQEKLYYLVSLILANVDPDIILRKMEFVANSIEKAMDKCLRKEFKIKRKSLKDVDTLWTP